MIRSTRLLAAMFAASGLFLAFPSTAGANYVPSAGVTCAGVDVSFTAFPVDENITITMRVDYPDGTSTRAHAFTYGEVEGVRHVDQRFVGAGTAHLTATWLVDTAHEYTNDYKLDCPAPPTTTTTVPPTTVPPSPPTVTPPSVTPPGPTMPVTGSGAAVLGAVAVTLMAAGTVAVRRTRART